MNNEIELDNRIYLLQQRKDLNAEQKEMLHHADIAFLTDQDEDARALVSMIEKQLKGVK